MEVRVEEDDDSEAPFEDGVGVEEASVRLGEDESVVDDTVILGDDPVPLGTICRYCSALSTFIAQMRVKIVNRNAMFDEERICLMMTREKQVTPEKNGGKFLTLFGSYRLDSFSKRELLMEHPKKG